MKNITETIKFPARSIVSSVIPKSLEDEISSLIQLENLPADAERASIARNDLLEKLPEPLKNALAFYGAMSPSDLLDVSIDLGHFLFDLYSASQKKPESPLSQRIYDRKMQDLATVFMAESFEIPEFASQAIYNALENDALWSQVQCNAYTTVGEEKRYFTMNSKGVKFFKQVLDAAVAEFDK